MCESAGVLLVSTLILTHANAQVIPVYIFVLVSAFLAESRLWN